MPEYSHNQNVVSASVEQNRFGLLEVSFVCEGNPEWPTALRSGNSPRGVAWTIYDNPIDAFRNGNSTTRYPPQYSYHRANRQIRSWTCRSILWNDGSAYSSNETRTSSAPTAADKKRVFSARVVEGDLGLKYVEFSGVGLINGRPIYPTALASGASILDSPIDAFWGGAASVNMPPSVDVADERIGAVWTTRTLVNADGSAISSSAENVLRQYTDIVDYNYPSALWVNSQGIHETPGTVRKYRATITEKLVSGAYLAADATRVPIPYFVNAWVNFHVYGTDTATGQTFYDAKSVHGALSDGISVGNSYRGMTITNTVANISSNPNMTTFAAAIGHGTMLIDCAVRRAFTDAAGQDWYILRTVYI
ncbi:MAG: hypothetical protein IJI37_06270 [Opitutales bacterium]|nr:hypothetical protein [Opitutales bacterium]